MKKIDEKKTLAQNAQNFVKIIVSQNCVFVRGKMLKKNFAKKLMKKTFVLNAQNYMKIILSQTCIFVRGKCLKKTQKKNRKIDRERNR